MRHCKGFLLERKSLVNHRDREKQKVLFLSHWCSNCPASYLFAKRKIKICRCTQSENHTPRPTSHLKLGSSKAAVSNRSIGQLKHTLNTCMAQPRGAYAWCQTSISIFWMGVVYTFKCGLTDNSNDSMSSNEAHTHTHTHTHKHTLSFSHTH